jgi:hypothetical protein
MMGSDNPTGGDHQQETAEIITLDARWVVGFVGGEGCFCVSLHRNPHIRSTGHWQLQPVFQVSQHHAHRAVLEALVRFFDCGAVRSKGPTSTVLTFSVYRLVDLERRIVPFFECHPLVVKHRDFARFSEIIRGVRAKEHLTPAGFERLARLAYAMNANGRQRARSIEEILTGSSETVRQARLPPEPVMRQSDLHGDMQS